MSLYYDKQGNPITMEEWARLSSDMEYRRVAETTGCGKWVSTVWLGLNHSHGGGPPLIFETMVFDVDKDGEINWSEIDADRYSTEEEALKGHERLCSGHAYILDRIVKKLGEHNEAVDDSDEGGVFPLEEGRSPGA